MLSLYFGHFDEWTLAEKVYFDGDARIIYVHPTVTDLDIRTDVYSAMVRWRNLDNNDQYATAMEFSGLDAIPGGGTTGDTYFLKNNWKLYVDLVTCRVTGVLYSRDFQSAYYTLEGNIQYPATVSSLVNNANATATVDTAAVAQAVWEYVTRTLTAGAGNGATAQEVWEYGTRSLTTAAGVTAQDISDIADAVWDEQLSGHASVGSTGEKLDNVTANVDTGAVASAVWAANTRTLTEAAGVTAQDITDIVDAVWDEDLVPHAVSNSGGALLRATLNDNDLASVANAVWTNGTRELTAFVGLNGTDLVDIANVVWDEPIAGNVNIGSFGEKLNDIAASADTAAIATAVWTSGTRTLSSGADISVSSQNAIATAVWSETTRELTTAPSILAADLTNIANSVWTRSTRLLSEPISITAPDIAAIADAVWDEPLLDHTILGTAGEALDDAQASVDQNSFVTAIWAYADRQLTATLAPSASAIATQVWSQPTRTLTTAPTLLTADINAIADAVWVEPTRTLTSTLAPNTTAIATAVWGAANRSLTASIDPDASAIAAAVWSETTRGLTEGVALSAAGLTSMQSSVWGAVSRTLTGEVTLTPATIADVSTDVWSETVRTITGDVNVSASSLGSIESTIWSSSVRTLTADVGLTTAAINAVSGAVWAETSRTLTETGLTGLETTMLTELWQFQGLDINNPVTQTQTQTTFGTVDVQYTGNSKTAVTATRQP